MYVYVGTMCTYIHMYAMLYARACTADTLTVVQHDSSVGRDSEDSEWIPEGSEAP